MSELVTARIRANATRLGLPGIVPTPPPWPPAPGRDHLLRATGPADPRARPTTCCRRWPTWSTSPLSRLPCRSLTTSLPAC